MNPLPIDDRGGEGIDSRKHAGFDYSETIRRLEKYLTQERIAYYMGYGAGKPSSLYPVRDEDSVPGHDKGEMLWALYVRIFKEKPPGSATQKAGLLEDDFLRSIEENVRTKPPAPPLPSTAV